MFTWSTLRKLSNNKYIKNMYFWAIFVPISARAFSLIENPIELLLFGDLIVIELTLPFSWSAFFFSSIFFSLALLLFNLICPKIILENETFSSYISDGKSLIQLNKYAREVGEKEVDTRKEKLRKDSLEQLKNRAQEKFWEIYEVAEDHRRKWKFVISILYFIGFTFMALVFTQNIIYVYEVAFD